MGVAYNTLGECQESISHLERVLTSDLKSYEAHHPDVAIGRNNLGSVYQALGEYQKATGYYLQALTVFKARLEGITLIQKEYKQA